MTSEEIRIAYAASGMTYKQLSEKSGVPFGTICRIMSGNCKEPRMDTVQQLASALTIAQNNEPEEVHEEVHDYCNQCKVINVLEKTIESKNKYLKILFTFAMIENMALLLSLIALVF